MEFPNYYRHIIVNYHYIENPRPERAGIHPCRPSEFRRQLEFLGRNFQIGTVEEVYEAAQKNSNERVCALTFDDCLKSQYQNALPILEQMKIPAAFFPITSTLEGVLPPAHRIHFLLSLRPAENLVALFNRFISENHAGRLESWIIPLDEKLPDKARPHKQESMATSNFKVQMLRIPPEARDEFFAYADRKLGIEKRDIIEEFFMNEKEIRDLAGKGFVLGNHSHGHFSYRNDDGDFLARDLERASAILRELGGRRPAVFSYPHGRFNEEMAGVLKNQGICYALTIENRAVEAGDSPYAIPRLDTNDIKPYTEHL